MPTQEPIQNTMIPKKEEPAIPVRVVVTKPQAPKVQPNPVVAQNGNQQTINETAPAADSATPAESVKLSPQLSALARKEQAFRQRELALKQREESQASDLKLAQEFKELKTKLSNKDFSEAEKLGLNYDEYVKYKIDQANGEDQNAQAMKKLEDQIKALEQGQEENAKQEFEETVMAYKKEIVSAVSNNPEYSTIKGKKAESHVLQLILDSWEEDQIEMSVEEACKDVEEALVADAKSYLDLPKFKTVEEQRKLPPPKPGVRTLTNQMQTTATTAQSAVPLSSLPEAQRYEEARRRVLARRQQQGR